MLARSNICVPSIHAVGVSSDEGQSLTQFGDTLAANATSVVVTGLDFFICVSTSTRVAPKHSVSNQKPAKNGSVKPCIRCVTRGTSRSGND